MTERCRAVEPLLSAWLDNSLSRAERSAVSRHLGRCERCRGELASLRRAVAVVRSAPTRCLPPEVRTTLLATAGVAPAYTRRSHLILPRTAATLLALLTALATSVWLLDDQVPGPQPAPIYVVDPAPTPVLVDSE